MKNMPSKKSVMSLALGSAVAVALGSAPIASAGESPFAAQSLSKGYMVAHAHGDKGYGKSGEGRCGMSMADTDKDGRVSSEEHARHSQMMFEKMDTNKDGYIDKDEMDKMRKMHGERRGNRGDRPGYGEREQSATGGEYGARSGGPELQHMKPMGQ